MADPVEIITENPPARTGGKHKCEFCGCALSVGGDVLEMSDKARELRRLQDDFADEKSKHGVTREALTKANEKIAELEGKLATATAPKKSWLTSDDI